MKKLMKVLIAMIALTVFFNACRKDDDVDSTPGSTSNDFVYATITGIVTDESDQPVIGVQVMTNGNAATTDINGIFVLKGDVDKKRCVLEFSRQGYMKRFHAIIPSSAVNYVNIMLQGEPFAQSIMTGNGGTVNLGSAGSVVFPANAFVINGTTTPYIGEVMVYANHLSPDNQNFPMLTPGGDLSGINANGSEVTLYSFGMANVTMKGTSGEDLQLAPGTNATITFPIAASQTSTAAQSIPLWYLDESDALWKEEGQAIRVGNNYVGNVTHFTWWNCDISSMTATISGRVVDCEDVPLSDVTVTVNGQMTLQTDQGGYYNSWVPSNLSLTFQVLPQANVPSGSQVENVSPLSNGQSFTVPDLEVPCSARISGELLDCNNANTAGLVTLKQNGSYICRQYTANGSFSFYVLPFTTYELFFVSNSGVMSQSATSNGVSTVVNLGQVQLCNNALSSTGFTIDGDGYDHMNVNFLLDTMNISGYTLTPPSTYINIVSYYTGGLATIHFELNCDSDDWQTIQMPDMATLFTDTYKAYSSNFSSDFQVQILQYGTVGDSIKGTFNGHLIGNSFDTVMITNGRFAALRAH